MYAVIRAGGKQYRVAPGDVIQVEKLSQGGGESVQFDEVLAVSASEGEVSKPAKAFVSGEVVSRGAATRCSSSTTSARSSTRSSMDIASPSQR